MTVTVDSKLPRVGTTIFTLMSQLAAEHGAINLSQGFPDFDPPPRLVELVGRYMREGLNQYAPMGGWPTGVPLSGSGRPLRTTAPLPPAPFGQSEPPVGSPFTVLWHGLV